MNNYVIIILILLCLFIVLRNFKITKILNIQENFKENIEVDSNPHCDAIVKKIVSRIEKKQKPKSYNFITLNNINPSNSINLIKQTEFKSNSYDINIKIDPEQNYNITQWVGTDSLYDGGVNNSEIVFENNSKINNYEIIDTKTINNIVWKKYIYIFKSLKNTKLIFKMGLLGEYSKGERFFSNIILKKSFRYLEDYKYQSDLTLFALFNRKYQQVNKFKDLIETNTIEFEKQLEIDSLGVNLNMTSGKIISNKQLIENDFTIFFTYKPNENEVGSLINIQGQNSFNTGIDIRFQTNVNNNNKMIINMVNKHYQFNIGLINKPVIITIVSLEKELNVYVNGSNIKTNTVNELSSNKELGNCPDGWKYLGDNKCEYVSTNKGDCNKDTLFLKNNKEKLEWAQKCKTSWINCDILFKDEVSKNNNSSCVLDTSLTFINTPIEINNNKSLSGNIHNVIIYKSVLSEEIIKNIYKYIIKNLLDIKNCDKVFDRPSIYKVHDHYPEEYIHNLDNLVCESESKMENNGSLSECPFDDKSVCNTNECKDVSFGGNLKNINEECKKNINEYCRFNKIDPECNRLRKLKHSSANSKKCTDCNSNINLSEYIKKDKVPCWNCNLSDVEL